MMKDQIPVYGIDKELAEKQASKYNPKREDEVKIWIEEVLKEKVFHPNDDFLDRLKDGIVLCKVANIILPNFCKTNTSTMPFKQMENINNFLMAAEKLGVPKADQFQTIDLYERKNPTQVLDSIIAFSRHAQKQNSSIPLLGPRLADKHQTSFSDEKLNAGKYMPSQQSGYHAAIHAAQTGATGSGIVYGARRDHGGADPKK